MKIGDVSLINLNTYYYHNDHLGSPQTMTDSAGTVVWEGEFMPFGEPLTVTGTITNNLRFPGQYYDEETGNNYNYFRDYNPVTGRYITPDPIGLEGGINLFVYVNANPISLYDYLGLEKQCECTNITIKRIKIRLNKLRWPPWNSDIDYGHWWIELGKSESYGWWPENPVGFSGTIFGVPGELNGQTLSKGKGTPTRDPHHGDPADEVFNPKISSSEECKYKTCEEAANCVRNFAKSYSGSWSWPFGQNCHSFQESAMSSCCLER